MEAYRGPVAAGFGQVWYPVQELVAFDPAGNWPNLSLNGFRVQGYQVVGRSGCDLDMVGSPTNNAEKGA